MGKLGVAIVMLGLTWATLSAQPAAPVFDDRAELAFRLRQFESAWETADEAGRRRALKILPDASKQFLGLDLRASGRTLDRARYALEHEGEPPVAWQMANSLGVVPVPTLADADDAEFGVTVAPWIKVAVPDDFDAKAVTIAAISGPGRGKPGRTQTYRVPADGPLSIRLPANAATLRVSIRGRPASPTRMVTRHAVEDLDTRLKSLETPAAGLTPLDAATLAGCRELLAEFRSGGVTDSEWLTPARTFELATALAAGDRSVWACSPTGPTQFWLTVPTAAGPVACRLTLPPVKPGQTVPVVVAMHGVGGSEHMFVEGYGSGCVAEAAVKNGMAFLSPRGSLFGAPPVPELLATLAKTFPIDADAVHLVGHSLGASQVGELLQRPGLTYKSAVILAGGGRVRDTARLKATRLWVAVGTEDFALKTTRRLRDTLVAGGVPYTYKEYDGVEHLVIVRAACADLPAFWAGR